MAAERLFVAYQSRSDGIMNRDQFKFWNAVGIITIGLLFYYLLVN